MKPTYEELAGIGREMLALLIVADDTLEGIDIAVNIVEGGVETELRRCESGDVIDRAKDLLNRAQGGSE